MATTRTVLQAMVSQIAAVTPSSPSFSLAVGWPPEDAIMSVPKTGYAVGGVFDAGPAPADRTRWHAITAVPDTNSVPGLTAVLSGSGFLSSGQHATVTIGGSPIVNDAVGIQCGYQAATVVATNGDTTTTIAAGLAAAVNASSVAATATSAGAVLTLTATSSIPVSVATSNIGTRTTEYHRITRFVRCVIWCPSEATRESIGDPIDLLFAQLEQNYGFQVTNGEFVRVLYDQGDLYDESLQLKDIYRRDFRTKLEYGVTGTSSIYPVVGFNLTP